MPLALGSVLAGRYRLTRLLGQGTLGAVYLATDERQNGQPCVVKATPVVSPETERLFRREAGLLANVHHPHLPRVTGHFVLDGQQYLVMDYVEGEDLQQRLDRGGPLPEPLVLRWAAPLCEAVRYLHSLVPPILHRDIKPANLKVTPQGQLVLVDFGVPRPSEAAPPAALALRAFTAPEQFGAGRLDARSDQYALAATLYALLVGQPPPDGVDRLLGNARLIPLRTLRPELSDRTAAALVRGLEVRPEDRFPDLLAFTQALLGSPPPTVDATAIGAGHRPPAPAQETLVQRKPAPPPAPPPPAPRPAPRVAVLPTVVVPPPPATPVAPPARARSRGPLYVVLGLVLLLLAAGAIALGSVAGAMLGDRFNASSPTDTPPALSPAASTATVPALVVAPSETSSPSVTLVPTDTAPPPTDTPVPSTETPTLVPTAAGTPIGSGGRLAFISNRDGQHFQVYTMNPDGTDVRQVTSDPTDKWDPAWTFGGTQLAWSPDGTRLLYVSASPAGNGTDLFMINADGSGEAVNLTAAPGDDFHPTWCGADGVWFTSLRANNTHQIFSTTLERAAAGLRPTNVSGTHNFPREFDPVLLPEGDCQRLLFVTTLQGRPEIWRYFLDCPNCYRVVRSERDNNGAAEEPALSADGLQLAYTRRLAASAEIVVGEVLNRLVNVQVTDTGLNFQPQFSPDGQWLVFTSERDGNREIYTMTAAGASQTNLTQDSAIDTDPVWQPVALP